MAIFIPKSDKDGSGLGLASQRWTFIHVSSSYATSSYINGSEISSGSQGLMADGHPFLVSPFHISNFPSLQPNQVAIRLNNLLPADGDYSLGGFKLTNAGYPTSNNDLANKLYVDNTVNGIKWKNSVKAASEPNGTSYFVKYRQSVYTSDGEGGFDLTDTGTPGWLYDSGSAGEGATLTFKIPRTNRTGNAPGSKINGGTWQWVSNTDGSQTPVDHGDDLFDGVNDLVVNDRILIKNFGAPYEGWNGIYEVQSTGSGVSTLSPSNPILVRTEDFNSGSEVPAAAVAVEEGTVNADIAYMCTVDTDTVDGQDLGDYPLVFSVFGHQTADNVTIYKDATQNNRFEVTGVLRDINDLFYDYDSPARLSVGDGIFLVGDGNSFVAESGNTARTSLGLGTGSNPTFNSLTLTDALTASVIISPTDTITLKDRLESEFPLTASHLYIENDASIGSLVSRSTIIAVSNITAGNQITATGNFVTANGSFATTNGNFTTTNGDVLSINGKVDAPFVTASVALSASQILLPSFNAASELPAGSSVVSNFLYNIDGRLFFNGGAIGGPGGIDINTMAFQDHENVFIHGGNIFSHSPSNEANNLNRFVRLGVSGSNLDGTYAGTSDRQPGLRIVEGSFIYLSASNAEISGSYGQFNILSGTSADIDGGTIDGTNIGLSVPAIGSFNELTASDIDINRGTLSDIIIDGNWTAAGQTCADLGTITTADINGGTIDGSDITVGAGKTLDVSEGTLTLGDGQVGADKVGAGTFDSGVYEFDSSSHVTASHVKITNLDVSDLTAATADINGGTLSNVTVDSSCTIEIDSANYTTLTASHLKVEDTLDLTLTGSGVSRISGDVLVVDGQNAIFDNGVFINLTASIVDINDGTIDFTDIGVGGPATGSFNELTASIGIISELTASDIRIDDGTATFSALTASIVDINGGTIDGTLIGTENPTKGVFNMLTSSDGVLTASHVRFGGTTGGDIYIKGHQGDPSLIDVNQITGSSIRAKDYFEFGINGTFFNMNYAPIERLYTIPTSSHGNSDLIYQNFAVNRKYIDYVITQKISVDTVADSNISNFSNLNASYSGYTWNDGDRILLRAQTDASENGIYFFDDESLFRSHDLTEGSRASGVTVFVTQGDFAKAAFICTSAKNADIVGTHDLTFGSGGGVYNAGLGLDKDNSANAFFVDINEGENLLNTADNDDRANLDFNDAGKLILSSSIHTDKAKFGELIATTADIDGGSIDDTVIGGSTPSDATFNNVVINTQLSASSGAKIITSKGEFDDIEVYGALETSTFTNERLVHISGTLQLASKASAPSNKSNRLYNEQGNLYWQNNLLSSTDGKGEYETLYVVGSDAGEGLFVSGTLIVGPEDFPGADAYAFISGAIGSKDGSSRGVTVLGGDTVISGNLYVGGQQVSAGGNPAADNITEGDDNVNITTSTGNITVRTGPGDNLTLSGSTVTLDADSSITVGSSLIPDLTTSQHDLGSNTRLWNNLYLSDAGKILFGEVQDVILEAIEPGTLRVSVADDTFGDPEVQIYSGFGGPTGPRLNLIQESATPAASDIVGRISFTGENSASDSTLYGAIDTKIVSTTDASERSDLQLSVRAGGDFKVGLVVSGTNSASVTTVDVPDHNGSNGGLMLGGTLLTVTGSELNLLDGDLVTASSGSSLRWDGSQMQWEEFDGGAATASQITEGDAAVNITTSTGNVTVKSGPGNNLILSGSTLTSIDADTQVTISGGGNTAVAINSSGNITQLANSGDVDSNNYYLTWDSDNSIAKWQTWRGFKHNRIEANATTSAAFGNHYSFEFDSIQQDHTLNLPAITNTSGGLEIRVLIKTNHAGSTLTINTSGTDTILNIDASAGDPIEDSLSFDVGPATVIGTSFTLVSDGNDQWEMI